MPIARNYPYGFLDESLNVHVGVLAVLGVQRVAGCLLCTSQSLLQMFNLYS
jgi:hypothetical protein